MSNDVWVGNSSPLIVFQQIEQLALLQRLVGKLLIPAAVRRELFRIDPLPDWIEERILSQPLAPQLIAARIGPGEREAIALALEVKANWLIIDDLAGRRLAPSLGIKVIGSAGLFLKAKAEGLVTHIRPLLNAMQSYDFYIAEHVVEEILKAADEL